MQERGFSSSSSRAVGVLLAIGVLIAFAGLAGLGATAISLSAPAVEPADAQPLPQAAPMWEKYGPVDSVNRIVAPADRRARFSDTTPLAARGEIPR